MESYQETQWLGVNDHAFIISAEDFVDDVASPRIRLRSTWSKEGKHDDDGDRRCMYSFLSERSTWESQVLS